MISFILHQYYNQHLTQPLLLEQLREFGVEISSVQLSRILTENKECFHSEKDAILEAGIEVSDYIQTDDTGARHKGKNGYCTYVGNEFFAWFKSTESKSRINFLGLLRADQNDYVVNAAAIEYMAIQGLAQAKIKTLENLGSTFANDDQWKAHLLILGINSERHKKIATEGALVGSLLSQGFPVSMGIVSSELLLVLDRPELPLQNNLSERDIRDYVKKRKISGSTRYEKGRQCRDTFASLKKTCRKHEILFWEYFKDKVSRVNKLLPLPDIIRGAATSEG